MFFKTMALFLLLVAASLNGWSAEQPLLLNDAVNIALSKNPAFLQLRYKREKSGAQVAVVRAQLFPTVNLSFTGGYKKDLPSSPAVLFGGDPYNKYDADLKLTQPLFFYGSFAAVDSAKKDVELSQLEMDVSSRDLTSNVIQAYYGLVMNLKGEKILERLEKIVKESLATSERRRQTGRGQLVDVLQVKTQLALLSSQIAESKNQLQISAANLATILGEPDRDVLLTIDSLEAPLLSEIDKEINLANYKLPELEKNKIAMAQVEDQKTVTLGQHLPNVVLTGDYFSTSYKKSELYTDMSTYWQVAVQLNIPLFSGLSSVNQRRALAAQAAQLNVERVQITQQLSLQQVISRKKLETAEQSIITGREALKLAQASSDEARKNYRNATIDFMVFNSIQQTFVEAESKLNTAKYNYIVALCNYFSASGQDMKKLVKLLAEVKL